MRMQQKVSASLKQALEKLKVSENTTEEKGGNHFIPSPVLSLPNMFSSSTSYQTIRIVLVTAVVKVMLKVELNG